MDKAETYKIINILVLVLLVFFLLRHNYIFLALACFISLVTVFFFPASHLFAKSWMKLGTALGNFNSKVLLSLVFFLFLTPLGYIYKILNRERTEHFNKDTKVSYFENSKELYSPVFFLRQW